MWQAKQYVATTGRTGEDVAAGGFAVDCCAEPAARVEPEAATNQQPVKNTTDPMTERFLTISPLLPMTAECRQFVAPSFRSSSAVLAALGPAAVAAANGVCPL